VNPALPAQYRPDGLSGISASGRALLASFGCQVDGALTIGSAQDGIVIESNGSVLLVNTAVGPGWVGGTGTTHVIGPIVNDGIRLQSNPDLPPNTPSFTLDSSSLLEIDSAGHAALEAQVGTAYIAADYLVDTSGDYCDWVVTPPATFTVASGSLTTQASCVGCGSPYNACTSTNCSDPQTDPNHCGTCGHACAANTSCKTGVCQ
jgi:hypothetical protein